MEHILILQNVRQEGRIEAVAYAPLSILIVFLELEILRD